MRDERLLNLMEVARYLGVSTRTIYRLIANGRLKAARIGSVWRFRKSDIDEFVERAIRTEDRHTDE